MLEHLIFLEKLGKKLPKNAQKREKFPFFPTHMTAQAFRDNQIGLIRIFKEYSKAFQKDGAKILINTKVIKVLLTEGVNPI